MTRRTTAALLLPLLALGACKDATTPVPEVRVSLAVSAGEPTLGTDADGAPTIQCIVHIEATAGGNAADSAAWSRMKFRYYTAANPGVAVDSFALGRDVVGEAFGGTHIGRRRSQSSRWRIVAGLPVTVEAEVFYLTGGHERSAAARAACGPQPDAAAGPPVLRSAEIAEPPPPLQPGDSIRISWTVDAPAGLWETGVQIEAVPEPLRFPESFAPGISRSITVRIPENALMGDALRLRVYAVDVLGRVAVSRTFETGPVVDTISPLLHELVVDGSSPRSLRGQFGAGDTIPFWINGWDNHRIAWLTMQVGDARDSVPMPQAPLPGIRGVVVPGSWAGREGFSAQLRDPSGNRSATRSAEPGAMRFYPVRRVQPISVQAEHHPRDAVLDEEGQELWTGAYGFAGLRAYAASDLAPKGTVPLPGPPLDLDLSVTGDTLVAVLGTSVAIVDLRRGRTVAIAAIDGVQELHFVRVSAAGEAVMQGTLSDGSRGLIGYTLHDRTQRILHRVSGSGLAFARSGDRRRMLVGGGCPYDPMTHTLGACRDLRVGTTMVGDRTGSRWAARGRVFDAELNTLVELPYGTYADGAWLTPAGDEVYFATERGPLRVRISDGRHLERYGTSWFTYGDLIVDPAGKGLLGWGYGTRYGVARIELP